MISLEQARKFYPPDKVPDDKTLQQILAAFYGIATREWDEMIEEKSHEKE